MSYHVSQGELLLSYVIASSNMRYIENNSREIYLRDDPQRGFVIQGEIPECGPDCHANLSQLLLEFTMSCEDCQDQVMTSKRVDQFGLRLGERLIANIYGDLPVSSAFDRLHEMMDILLKSMDASYEKKLTADQLRYDVAYCPIRAEAKKSGLNLWVAAAHQAFVALCSYVVRTVAPDWVLLQPSDSERDVPLDTILIIKV